MIGTYFYQGQGLGNQLWSYYTVRLLSILNNSSFSILAPSLFKGADFIKIDNGKSVAHPVRSQPNSNLFETFLNYYGEPQVVYTDEFCDVRPFDSRILNVVQNTLIDGYFQSERLGDLVDHNISDFFEIVDVPDLDFLRDQNVCILNVRGGVYKPNRRLSLHRNYWRNGIEFMRRERGVKTFYIVTDDVDYSRTLLPGIAVLEQNTHYDFIALTKATNLIVSNSSFSYFPIRLNNQTPFVIAPMYWARHNVSTGYWACRSNIYKDYHYMDRKSRISNALVCAQEADEFIKKNYSKFTMENHDYVTRHPNRLMSFLRNRIVFYG